MLTMQTFYDRLIADDQQNDEHWQFLRNLVNTSLERLNRMQISLSWYYWGYSQETGTKQ